jgi:hypothetical protein
LVIMLIKQQSTLFLFMAVLNDWLNRMTTLIFMLPSVIFESRWHLVWCNKSLVYFVCLSSAS